MRSGFLLAVLLLAAAHTVQAQTPAPAEAAPEAVGVPQPSNPPADVDATKLGVSMSRIQKGLRLSEAREERGGTPFKLEYQIQVFGLAPRFNVLEDFDIGKAAPLSYGAPTHADFIRQWTPQAYRSPRWPVGALAGWAFMQVAQKAEKSKCEQEIADYRALIMQGVSAPAPRCTQ